MARKRKKGPKKKGGRRMGATGKGAIMEGLKFSGGVLLGILAGRIANSTMATVDAKLMGGAEFAVGAFVVGKSRNVFVKGVGAGVAGNGGAYALGSKGLNVLPASMGYGPPMQYGYRSINGYREVPKIGFPRPGAIGGGQPNMESSRVARMYAGIYN